MNVIFCVLRGWIAWRLLPTDFPSWRTVYRWFARLRDESVFERMNQALVIADRQPVGREAIPSAAIVDSQSAKTTESSDPRGFDAGKKIKIADRNGFVTLPRRLVVERFIALMNRNRRLAKDVEATIKSAAAFLYAAAAMLMIRRIARCA